MTTEKVYQLGQFYRLLSDHVTDGRGANAADMQNAINFPLLAITKLITRAHQMRKMNPAMDAAAAKALQDITPEELEASFTRSIPLDQQGSFHLGYRSGWPTPVLEHDTLGERIAYYRKHNNLSQKELAEAIGARQVDVSRWENNVVKPNIDTLKALADTFGCSADNLLS